MHFCHFCCSGFFQFGKNQPSKSANIHTKSKVRASKCVEMADFALLTLYKIVKS